MIKQGLFKRLFKENIGIKSASCIKFRMKREQFFVFLIYMYVDVIHVHTNYLEATIKTYALYPLNNVNPNHCL